MSLKHTVGTVYKTNAGTIVSLTDDYTDDAEIVIDHATAASTTNQEIDFAVTYANIQCMVMYSDQTVLVKTNSTGAPGDTITLTAKKALIWNTDRHESCPITSNITKVYVTNTNTSAANLAFRFLLDQVP
jgi:hypothetical protein